MVVAFFLSPSSIAHGASLQDLELPLGGVEVGLLRKAVAHLVAPEPDREISELYAVRSVGRGEAKSDKKLSRS